AHLRAVAAVRCGSLLLPDLRVLQLGDAAGNSLCREALAQAARAARDERSLEPASFFTPGAAPAALDLRPDQEPLPPDTDRPVTFLLLPSG
ncbi:hypothetical protein ACFC5A_34515, partial [Streptomyces yangpuensis]